MKKIIQYGYITKVVVDYTSKYKYNDAIIDLPMNYCTVSLYVLHLY